MADMTPSHAFSAVAENGMCRHATGFVKMGHISPQLDLKNSVETLYKPPKHVNIYNSKYNVYIAPYSPSDLWRCTLFLELCRKIFIHLNKIS